MVNGNKEIATAGSAGLKKNKELDNRPIILTLIIHVAPHIYGFSLGEKRKDAFIMSVQRY